MKTIRVAIEIAQAQEVVFDLTQNYAQRLEWDPYLSEAYLMKNATEPAVGVDAYCKNRNGSVMVSLHFVQPPECGGGEHGERPQNPQAFQWCLECA